MKKLRLPPPAEPFGFGPWRPQTLQAPQAPQQPASLEARVGALRAYLGQYLDAQGADAVTRAVEAQFHDLPTLIEDAMTNRRREAGRNKPPSEEEASVMRRLHRLRGYVLTPEAGAWAVILELGVVTPGYVARKVSSQPFVALLKEIRDEKGRLKRENADLTLIEREDEVARGGRPKLERLYARVARRIDLGPSLFNPDGSPFDLPHRRDGDAPPG